MNLNGIGQSLYDSWISVCHFESISRLETWSLNLEYWKKTHTLCVLQKTNNISTWTIHYMNMNMNFEHMIQIYDLIWSWIMTCEWMISNSLIGNEHCKLEPTRFQYQRSARSCEEVYSNPPQFVKSFNHCCSCDDLGIKEIRQVHWNSIVSSEELSQQSKSSHEGGKGASARYPRFIAGKGSEIHRTIGTCHHDDEVIWFYS